MYNEVNIFPAKLKGICILDKEMTTHSSILAWETPWTGKPGGRQSMGSQESEHDLATKPPLCIYIWASLVAQMVKNLSVMQGTWVRALGWENPLEKGMATHSNIFIWRIPWPQEADGLQSMGCKQTWLND